jgi:hypothetical protein
MEHVESSEEIDQISSRGCLFVRYVVAVVEHFDAFSDAWNNACERPEVPRDAYVTMI